MSGTTTMLTYVQETPDQLALNLEQSTCLTQSLVDAWRAGSYHHVWIIACGSSFNAAQCAKPFMMKYLDVDVQIVPPASFLLYKNLLRDDDFVFAISQSGCSTNSIKALDKIRELGHTSIGLTGNLQSDFKDHADILVDYGVGSELIGYVTKGVATLAEFLMLFALEAAYASGRIDSAVYQRVRNEMAEVPSRHKVVQEASLDFYKRNRAMLTSMTVAYHCGFAQGYGVACEGALKLGETIKVPSFAYEAEEYIHGPNLQLTPNYTVFFIDDFENGSDRLYQIFYATNAVTDRCFAVTNNPQIDDSRAVRLPFDIREPRLTPLYALPFYQTIAFKATDEMGCWKQHPVFEEFRKRITSKTPTIDKVMPMDH